MRDFLVFYCECMQNNTTVTYIWSKIQHSHARRLHQLNIWDTYKTKQSSLELIERYVVYNDGYY